MSHHNGRPSISGTAAFNNLVEGNRRFVTGNLYPKNLGGIREDLLVNGQHPFAVIITCSDSRVPGVGV